MQAATLRVISSRLAHRCMPPVVGVAALGGPQRRLPIAGWPRAATPSGLYADDRVFMAIPRRPELGAIEHWNFLFGMKWIRP
ncbi:hypothetical protein B296_00014653 [Ensete ventricosum]|uniref:Uncharacterized protein n=1 Tax=Ensete ventricosum TaxID=4639 RepID=A0A427AY29_ENSVE|nr:hypothetical protein B296_00014653 [Ensete ventricosum]